MHFHLWLYILNVPTNADESNCMVSKWRFNAKICKWIRLDTDLCFQTCSRIYLLNRFLLSKNCFLAIESFWSEVGNYWLQFCEYFPSLPLCRSWFQRIRCQKSCPIYVVGIARAEREKCLLFVIISAKATPYIIIKCFHNYYFPSQIKRNVIGFYYVIIILVGPIIIKTLNGQQLARPARLQKPSARHTPHTRHICSLKAHKNHYWYDILTLALLLSLLRSVLLSFSNNNIIIKLLA